jgi:outer membrane protein TolC
MGNHAQGGGSALARKKPAPNKVSRKPVSFREPGRFVYLLAAVCCFFFFTLAAIAEESLTLEQAIATALEQNPDTKIAEHQIAAAQAGIRQAEAAFWPQVQLNSNYTRTNNPASVFGLVLSQRAFNLQQDFNHPPDTDDWNMRASVNLALFNGGRNIAGRDGAKAGAEAARYAAQAVRTTLAFEVARAFFTVIKARKFIEATKSNVRALESNYQIAQKHVNAGTALKTDLLDVGVQLSRAREDNLRAVNAASLAAQVLVNLLGSETKELDIDSNVKEPAVPKDYSYENQPEVLAAKAQVRAAQAALRKANGGYLPRISAFANLDRDQGWETDESGDSWTAGVMAQLDAWDGMLTSGRVQEAEAGLLAAREEERKLRLRLNLELEQARNNLQDAEQRLTVTEQAVSQAKESAELTRARYEQGLATATQIIDSETALTVAQVRRAEAEADRRIAVAALRKALGLAQF